MSYKIYLRDQYLNRIAEIEDFLKLDIIPRFNAVGSWVMDIPTDSNIGREIIADQIGIIVVKDGTTILSGPVKGINRKWAKNQDVLVVSGTDDNVLLNSLAYPVASGNFTLSDYDVRTDAAETVIKEYVDINIGPNALPQRRVPNLIIEPNTGAGSRVTGRARFHQLLELSKGLALAGGDLGFRIIQEGKNLVFQVYQPTDKSRTAIFSPLLGNLINFDYDIQPPEANFAIVGGGGEGKDRILLEKSDTKSIIKFGRIETFIDRRDTTNLNELQQALDEELASKAEKASLKITPTETDNLSYGRHYKLGDRVSVVITQPNEVVTRETFYYFISAYQTVPVDHEKVNKYQEKLAVISDVIREIKITITPEGSSISPVIGTPESLGKSVLNIFDRMRKFQKRVSNLERI